MPCRFNHTEHCFECGSIAYGNTGRDAAIAGGDRAPQPAALSRVHGPAARPALLGPLPLSRGAAAERVEAACVHQLARQRVPDDVLGHPPDLDQRVEIDAGVDAHLLA